jgi:hypothetical protein
MITCLVRPAPFLKLARVALHYERNEVLYALPSELRLYPQLQVLWPVISTEAVLVVDGFPWPQVAALVLFHHVTVLGGPLAVNGDIPITAGVKTALTCGSLELLYWANVASPVLARPVEAA